MSFEKSFQIRDQMQDYEDDPPESELTHLRARVQRLEEALREVVDSPGCGDNDCCPAARKQTAAIENAKAALASSQGREPERAAVVGRRGEG